MANFDQAISVVLRHEGGFVNNPDDPGLITNYGISQVQLSKWRNQPVTPADMIDLTIDQAKALYKTHYWDLLRLDSLKSDLLATLILDMAVLRGPGRVVQDLQSILGIHMDSIMGPVTIETLNVQTEREIGVKFLQACELAFVFIVQGKPTQVEFLAGWISRCHSLLNFLLDI